MLALLLISSKWIGMAGIVLLGCDRMFTWGLFPTDDHYIAGVIFPMFFALAQVMTIYYFYGMRKALVLACSRHDLDPGIGKEAVALKKRVAGRGYILSLLATAMPIAGGGAYFGPIPLWIHYVLAAATVVLGIQTAIVEYRCFRRNARLFERAAALIEKRRGEEAMVT